MIGVAMNYSSSRRQFVKKAMMLGATGIVPGIWSSNGVAGIEGLAFLNLHTGESLKTAINQNGQMSPEEVIAVNSVLRDHRSGEIHLIDPNLLILLTKLQDSVGVKGPFHVISGYRSPTTNAKMKAAGRGVATRSLHLQGKAIDIRLPGCELKTLRDAALALKGGGVGYYAKSNFVHIDTGRVRYW